MSIDFRIRDFCYPLTIWELHRRLDRSQWLAPEELAEYQNERLRRIIRHAFEKVPYYRRLATERGIRPEEIKTREDLARLPLLGKEVIRERPSDLQAPLRRRLHARAYTTSGTTGQPLTFYLDKYANALEFAYYWRYWGWAGFRPGMKFAELTSHYFLVRPELASDESHLQRLFNRLLLNSNQISVEGCRQMARAIRRFRPRFLKGVSSALYFFALSLKEAGINDISFQAIFSTGEVLTRLHRTLLEEVLGAPVFDSYGHMERTVAICQCPEGSYHINSDYGLLECLDEETAENGVRLARAVGTGLYNLAMPLIRYEIGDQIELFEEPQPCPCGRGLPTVRGIHGRSQDVIRTPDGRFLTALFIIPEFVDGARFVQFIQVRPETLLVHVVPSPSWDGQREDLLREYCRRMVGERMNVEFEKVEPEALLLDESGKMRTVVGLESL